MSAQELEAEFAGLLERNHARWAGIARAYAPPAERDDLVQEILLQVWRALPNFARRSHVDTWAYRVALNTSLAWDRSAKTRRARLAREHRDLSQLAAGAPSHYGEAKLLDEFLQSLSKVDRALMLVYLDGIANAEAAEILGMSEGALRVRLHRLRKKFQVRYCEVESKS
jgi:RNA polymerase sigma-70 factor (ECF subfamily)